MRCSHGEKNRAGLLVLAGLAGLFGVVGILNLVSYLGPGGQWEHLLACGVALNVSGHCTVLWWIITRSSHVR